MSGFVRALLHLQVSESSAAVLSIMVIDWPGAYRLCDVRRRWELHDELSLSVDCMCVPYLLLAYKCTCQLISFGVHPQSGSLINNIGGLVVGL